MAKEEKLSQYKNVKIDNSNNGMGADVAHMKKGAKKTLYLDLWEF